MARRRFMLWVVVFVFVFVVVFGLPAVVEGLGMNWGTQATHQLPARTVVKMLKDNGVTKVKLFDADPVTLSALAGSGIEVMVGIPNDMLAGLGVFSNAQAWVRSNVTRYNWQGGVNITYVAVGNEPFLSTLNGSFINVTFPALQNIQTALDQAGLGVTVKATIPLNADVYNSPPDNNVPSAGRFRSDISDLMSQIVHFFNDNGAPFTVNIYPFLSLYGNPNFPISYAFFDGGTTVNDNGVIYTNVLDANFDTLVSALNAAGVGNLRVLVGEVGWPTDGDINANSANAQRFYGGLLRRLAANTGTPLRPGTEMEVYLFSLIDEDAKSVAPGNFERHWGIFGYDGQPKYPMDLSGQGQGRTLVGATRVEYLERQWCAFDPSHPNSQNQTLLGENINYACTFSDCTSLGYGSTCNGLDAQGNASYAFNMYFQVQNQQPGSCYFQGLAAVTTVNLSQGTCNFMIEIAGSSAAAPPRLQQPVFAKLLLLLLVVLVVLF